MKANRSSGGYPKFVAQGFNENWLPGQFCHPISFLFISRFRSRTPRILVFVLGSKSQVSSTSRFGHLKKTPLTYHPYSLAPKSRVQYILHRQALQRSHSLQLQQSLPLRLDIVRLPPRPTHLPIPECDLPAQHRRPRQPRRRIQHRCPRPKGLRPALGRHPLQKTILPNSRTHSTPLRRKTLPDNPRERSRSTHDSPDPCSSTRTSLPLSPRPTHSEFQPRYSQRRIVDQEPRETHTRGNSLQRRLLPGTSASTPSSRRAR